jgi:hypothetical protein
MASQICEHVFCEEDNVQYCCICGIELDTSCDLKNDFCNSSYSIKVATDNYDNYLTECDPKLKKDIITTFEAILKICNLRGDGKKALLSACYMYKILDSGKTVPCRYVQLKFNLTKKKFSEGKKVFQHWQESQYGYDEENIQLKTSIDPKTGLPVAELVPVEQKISDFVDHIFTHYSLDQLYIPEIREKCLLIDDSDSFTNFNPNAVCACIIFFFLHNKNKIQYKKNEFIRKIGISDVTVQKIAKQLIKNQII